MAAPEPKVFRAFSALVKETQTQALELISQQLRARPLDPILYSEFRHRLSVIERFFELADQHEAAWQNLSVAHTQIEEAMRGHEGALKARDRTKSYVPRRIVTCLVPTCENWSTFATDATVEDLLSQYPAVITKDHTCYVWHVGEKYGVQCTFEKAQSVCLDALSPRIYWWIDSRGEWMIEDMLDRNIDELEQLKPGIVYRDAGGTWSGRVRNGIRFGGWVDRDALLRHIKQRLNF